MTASFPIPSDGSVTTGKLADGAVTPAKLSFDPATQTELDVVAGAVTAEVTARGTAVTAEATARAAADTTHEADTTAVHGIADTSKLIAKTGLAGDVGKVPDASTGLPISVVSGAAQRVVGSADLDITGATDVTTALQAILTAEAGQREVVLAKGTYLTTGLTLPSGLRLRGTKGSIIKHAAAGAAGQTLSVAAATTDVVVRDIEIDGNATNQTNTIHGIFSRGSTIRFEGLYVHDTQRSGIVVDGGSSNVDVVSCLVYNTGFFGILGGFYSNETDPITRLHVRNCRVDLTANGASGMGIIVSKADGTTASPGGIDCVFADSYITRTDHDGIAAYSPNNVRLIVRGNIVDNAGFTPSGGGAGGHLTHVGGTDLLVEGNIGRNIDGAGIVVSNFPNSAPPAGAGALVIGNILDGTVQPLNGEGILTQNYSDVAIIGNRVTATIAEGIHVTGSYGGVTAIATDITLDANHCTSCGKAGIYVEEGAKVAVSGGVLRGNGTQSSDAGVRFKGVISSAINGVVSCDNTLDGIRLVDGVASTSLDVAIAGCTLANNGGWGVQSAGSCNRIALGANVYRSNVSGPLSLVGVGNAISDYVTPSIPTIASATTITPSQISDYMLVSGTTTITSVLANRAGRRIVLKFTAALTLTDGSNLVLAGNFVTTADDTISLVSDGTNWIEAARSVN